MAPFCGFTAKMAATDLHGGRVGNSFLYGGGCGFGEDASRGVGLHRGQLGGCPGRRQHSRAAQLAFR